MRADPLWCTYVLDPSCSSPQVAFAIGRPVGTAVVRNRLRRRLRALVQSEQLPNGWFLLGARPGAGELTFEQLTGLMSSLSSKLAARAGTA